ncbi:MAG: tryptophan-rich sensory protein [Rhodospirillales bacterium]|nr:tryptophan-rich sensory protein [Rhodospirillales bacterium]
MTASPSSRRRSGPDLLGLAGFAVLCLAVSGIGGAITATSVDGWYQTLQKPSFNPPDWVFGPVWTVLYVMMAVAAWRVWRRAGFAGGRAALTAFLVQLGLNLAWTVLFFGLQAIGLALIEIVVLLAAIVVTAVLFRRIDRLAGWLLAPYGLWVAYAMALNTSLWLLN